MLSLMKKIFLSLFLIFAAFALQAQNDFWEEAKGPYGGGSVIITQTSNGLLYAVGGPRHVYRSDDAGLNWVHLSNLGASFPDAYKYIKIGQAGSILLRMEDYSNGLTIKWYKSVDDGQNWNPLDSTIVELYETKNGVLIATRSNSLGSNPVWRSADDGETWTATPAELIAWNDAYNIFTPSGGIAIEVNDTLYRSNDDGLNWSVQALPDQFFNDLFITPSGIIFATRTSEQTIYRSEDGGATFTPVLNLTYSDVSFAVLNSGKILVQAYNTGGLNKLYSSSNQGLDWVLVEDADGGAGGDLKQTTPLSGGTNGTILKGHMDALLRSNNGGKTWQFSGNGLRTNAIFDIKFVSDSQYYALSYLGLWRTTDAGENWQLCKQNLIETHATAKNRFDVNQSGSLALIHDKTLQWSNNFGETFTDITPPGGLDIVLPVVFINPIDNSIYTNGINGVLRSTNFGQSWDLVLEDTLLQSMAFHPSGRIIANCNVSVMLSDDNGSSWTSIPGFQPPALYSLVATVAPNGDIYISRATELWKSSDVGDNWQKLSFQFTGNSGLHRNALYTTINGHLYALSNDKLYLSVNGGLSWQNVAKPSSLGSCRSFAISPGQRLFANFYGQTTYLSLLYQSSAPVTQGAYIEGYINVDADADCSTLDAQEPLNNRIVVAESETNIYFTNTVADGHYIFFVDTGAYQVTVKNPNSIWWAYCEDEISVSVPELFVSDTANFVALPRSYCPLMTVDVGIPNLRRCFNNEVYVEYCNQGTEPADSAWVDVMLDPYLTLVNASQPYETLGANTIRFYVGDIPSGECNQLQLTVYANCDSTVLGQTHCVMAHGFPDTLCTIVPDWSGANIEAMVTCQDSILQFTLKNTGSAASQILDFIIFEDDIVLFSGQEDYNIAEDVILNFPANGKTWRIESEQEPGHPFSNLALAFAEGCGGFNSLGYITQFPVNGIQPSWHRMCVDNIGSYDPNDKQGFPTGTGDDHNIRPGQTIDYLIRFQNTGTDTAFTVEIHDTLSAFLDPSNIRPGASSHPYTWNLSGQGVISFTFNNIMLPDSNVNEPRSHGFVQFSITPYLDVPLGSVIENSAAIYFDFNEPVITNTTWHTIQKSPLTSSLQPEPTTVSTGLAVWPNPFSERTNIHVEKKTSGNLLLKIYDSRGTLVGQKTAFGPDIELHAKNLPTGLYWAEVRDSQGKLVGNGKLVKE